ncbi:hypothetical protein L873DRAFT_746635 [Choiromyces venosus 120613-1]|uniref:Uncharacterized protein n=1 Tax=Choiromyces venosus 120613-1 TaxID=1336337 RepID=A0A3N4JRA9_9PEZI|nr:hypothetical protein L873DRAFT_746635 [Choiromyces venosus 120613-1]
MVYTTWYSASCQFLSSCQKQAAPQPPFAFFSSTGYESVFGETLPNSQSAFLSRVKLRTPFSTSYKRNLRKPAQTRTCHQRNYGNRFSQILSFTDLHGQTPGTYTIESAHVIQSLTPLQISNISFFSARNQELDNITISLQRTKITHSFYHHTAQ